MKIKLFLLSLFIASSLTVATAPFALAQNEVCKDWADKLGGFLSCGNDDDIVSFTEFKGGLNELDVEGSGLDPTLTKAGGNFREILITIINFALTFLGIIAVAVVIYGGFLYVTSGTSEDQSGKGKKAITYAVLGILIIISSYAFVNTFITLDNVDETGARGGSNGSTAEDVRGAAQEGTNALQARVFNFGAVEIQKSMNQLLKSYQNLININGLVVKLVNTSGPTERTENRAYIHEVASIVQQIQSRSSALSKTGIAARKMNDEYLSKLLSLSREQVEEYSLLQKDILNEFTSIYKIPDAAKEDFTAAITEIAGDPTNPNAAPTEAPSNDETVKGQLLLVWKVMGLSAKKPNVSDIKGSATDRQLVNPKDVQRAFAGIDPNTTVDELFSEAIRSTRFANQATKGDPTDNAQAVIEAIKSIERLYIAVRHMKFVSVAIKASTREGNAPMIVELNGLGSIDPIGKTIDDANFEWDPDGDGEPGVSTSARDYIECTDSNKPVITCTYNKPGNYLARLTVRSADPTRVATGQASFSITVKPSLSRINLVARVENTDISIPLRQYVDRGGTYVVEDENEFAILSSEAGQTGITFDASKTTDATGRRIEKYDWDFGDGSNSKPQEGNQQDLSIVKHKYPGKIGRYRMKLEVTDAGGRKDRKFATILIGDLAPRVKINKKVAEPDELIEFDGSISRSDNGRIESYEWQIRKDKNQENIINSVDVVEVVGESGKPTLRVKFKEAGTYKVTLRIADSISSATKDIEVSIKSKKPRANFSVRSCPENCADETQPSLVLLDASQSFDPDPKDVLNYSWKFVSEIGDILAEGTDFTIVEGKLNGTEDLGGKKLRAKFKNIGKVKAILVVDDQHDDNLRQEDKAEKTFTINSTIDAAWDQSVKSVVPLIAGAATVKFTANAAQAENVEVDFGVDGFSGNYPVTNGVARFEQTYSAAGSYIVTATFTSDKKGTNTIRRRVYIGNADSPLAVIRAYTEGNEIVLDSESDSYSLIRNQIVRFDAGDSISSNGGNTGLEYIWNFGNGKKSTGATAQLAFAELSPSDGYDVTLTVTEKRDSKGKKNTGGVNDNFKNQVLNALNAGDEIRNANRPSAPTGPVTLNDNTPQGLQVAQDTLQSSARLRLKVISTPPQIASLSLEKVSAGNVTPIDVKVTAEGATDPDGRITNFQFWYYSNAEPERKLGVIDTKNNNATITIDTYGESSAEREYYFCASATDNENTRVECNELIDESARPKIKIKNGPNLAPTATFAVSPSTSVKNDQEITFTSSSTDVDGRIVKYVWDVEGDGFHNNDPTESATITHKYTTPNKDGYRVKLKVIDDKGASGYSTETKIYVDPKSSKPLGDFDYKIQPGTREVKFFDKSTADTTSAATLTKWTWDFDTSAELGCDLPARPHDKCNGDKTDDPDSADQNPIYTFAFNGDYQVKLVIEDNYGNVSRPFTKIIRVFTYDADLQISNGTATSTAGTVAGSTPPARTEPLTNREIAEIDVKANLVALSTEATMRTNPDGKKIITLPASSRGSDISLCWGDSRGDIVSAWIDKNIYCDSDGDGDKTNDKDYLFPTPSGVRYDTVDVSTQLPADRCWKTYFSPLHKSLFTSQPNGTKISQGRYVSLLHIDGREGGASKQSTNEVEIRFPTVNPNDTMFQQSCESDTPTLSGQAPDISGVNRAVPRTRGAGNIFEDLGIQNTIILSVVGGALFILLIFSFGHFFKGGKIREE